MGPVWAGFAMAKKHSSAVLDVEGDYFQAICACGWLSTVSYLEEVDLLRAMHIHAHSTFKSYHD
jgi:hypothetical protein